MVRNVKIQMWIYWYTQKNLNLHYFILLNLFIYFLRYSLRNLYLDEINSKLTVSVESFMRDLTQQLAQLNVSMLKGTTCIKFACIIVLFFKNTSNCAAVSVAPS